MTTEKKAELCDRLLGAIEPLVMYHDLSEAITELTQMFCKAVENADVTELDNYTAKELSPLFKDMVVMILSLNKIPEIQEMNN